MDYDVIIVGAGASGLMAAITAARQGSSVLVIEQKDKAGKKILATGNGKCNFTNRVQNPECYRSEDSAFAMKVLSCFDVSKTLEFFVELGIYPKERGGYYYPNSEQAASVVQVLLMECERLNVTFQYGETVTQIIKPEFTVITEKVMEAPGKIGTNNKGTQNTKCDTKSNDEDNRSSKNKNSKSEVPKSEVPKSIVTNNTLQKNENIQRIAYYGKNLILAAGGCASPQLGSDGSGYGLAKGFGHSIVKPLPALVQLKASDKYCKTVSGVRALAVVTAFADNKQLTKEEGEILFTDYGISGIPIMQISRYVAKALDKGERVHLLLDFLPEVSKEEVRVMLQKRIAQNPNKSMEEMMVGLFNHKLSYILINEVKYDPFKLSSKITEQEVETLANQVKSFRMNIADTNTFENAQVCAGGVSTKEIEETSMESKLRRHLYLVGELVDVDGTCGGYNLQWAWSSGYLAGMSVGRIGAR